MTDWAELQTSDLAGVALDWAVSQAEQTEGVRYGYFDSLGGWVLVREWSDFSRNGDFSQSERYSPSELWAQGGPLLDAYGAELRKGKLYTCELWEDFQDGHARYASACGETALVALCRAVVSLNFGRTVKVPGSMA